MSALKLALVFPCLALSAAAMAGAPIKLNYTVTPDGGEYLYDFTLSPTVAPNGTTGFGWIIFGDVQGPSTSPISDFYLTSSINISGGSFLDFNSGLPSSPISYLTSSGGGHNGPTLGYVLDCWVPTSMSDTITWSGKSATLMNTMRWSAIASRDFALDDPLTPSYEGFVDIQWEKANPVPEPASMLALGGAVMAFARRRRS